MTHNELLKLFKYYQGENEPPNDFDANARLWWGGEKLLAEKCEKSSYWNTLSDLFDDAEKSSSLSGILTDTAISKSKRIVIFFLDIWHGKYFPYDSLDAINDY